MHYLKGMMKKKKVKTIYFTSKINSGSSLSSVFSSSTDGTGSSSGAGDRAASSVTGKAVLSVGGGTALV